MEAVRILLLFLLILSVGYALFGAYCTWVFFQKGRGGESPTQPLPPISVLKPLADAGGIDLENLSTFCVQDYPVFEIIFALPANSGPSIILLEKLKARFPQRNIRWVSADQDRGPNYKIGNLIGAVRKAGHPILVISDSDMRAPPCYLRHVVGAFLQEKVGLVTSLYRNARIDNIPAALEALTVQTHFMPHVLFDRKVEGLSYAFGATLCTSKEILQNLGGIKVLLDFLADDYQMGNRIHGMGYRVALSPCLMDQVSGTKTLRDYLRHQLRAGITHRACRPWGYFASGVTHQVFIALLFLLAERFSLLGAGVFLLTCSIRITSAAVLNRTAVRNREITRYLWLTPLNDLINTLIWLLSLFMNIVYWKGRRFRVLKGGRMVELS
jgi:ceramide glucosyltransferase